MRFFFCVYLLAFALLATATHGGERKFVGVGQLMNNDVFATIHDDRWRTGSSVLSVVHSRQGTAQLPAHFGDLLEYRFRGEVISPANIVAPAPGDRPYAGVLSFGLHSHFAFASTEISAGVDLALTGSQTGLHNVQAAIHDVLGFAGPSTATLSRQIPNDLHPSLTLEAARRFTLSEQLEIRPFIEILGGLETLARVGGDIHIGRLAMGELLIRDAITGQRYRIQRTGRTGWATTFGADFAWVADSRLLPASSGVKFTDTRSRVRAGLHIAQQCCFAWQRRHTLARARGLTPRAAARSPVRLSTHARACARAYTGKRATSVSFTA